MPDAHGNGGAFPLQGRHRDRACGDCHGTGDWGALDPACVACHRDDYDGTTAPGHVAAGFPTTCQDCHGFDGWTPAAGGPHGPTGAFPLAGKHAGKVCNDCHGNPPWADLDPACVSCHRDDYDGTTAPAHVSAGFPTTCQDCHGFDAWRPAEGGPHGPTGAFPLTGKHAGKTCNDCHGNPPWADLDPACVTCHRDDYDGTTAPAHVSAGFPTTCQDCHGFDAWRPAEGGPHGPTDAFPLAGKHAGKTCNDCHGNPPWADLDPACVACHRDDYDGTTAPGHVAAGFPTACQDCHGFEGWTPAAGGPHGPTDAFPLEGKHAGKVCNDCHGTPPWADLDPACVSCHRDDYDGTTAPAHVSAGFPTTCADCHGLDGWTPAAGGPHGPTDAFPLAGKHAAQSCNDCHGNPPWADLDPACVTCHRDDYDGATDPGHAASGFPTTCADCHKTFDAWEPATAGPHGAGQSFPLTGGHAGPPCKDCHKAATYADVPRTCDGCHAADYNASTNPGHARLALPRTCQTCHTIQSWKGATLGAYHKFPITSGKHAGAACATCHPSGQPWATFTCLTCHEHNRTETDGHHVGEQGYSYDTAACYRCHPRGTEGGD